MAVQKSSSATTELQIDELSDGTKVLTCYLLPQQSEDSDGSSIEQDDQQADTENFERNRQAAVSFDPTAVDDEDEDFEGDAQFVRHDTPHPRELKARHQKLFNNSTTPTKPELKGLDNASFVVADGLDTFNNNNINDNRDYGHQQQSTPLSAYKHLDYEPNGLPEISTTMPQSGHVQTTSKLFEAFRQKSSDYPVKYDHNEDGRHKRENGLDQTGNRDNFESTEISNTIRRDVGYDDKLDSTPHVIDILVRRFDHHKPGLGLSIAGGKDTPPFKDNDEGIFVSKVTRGGPAEAAGVKMGDKILAVNEHMFYEGITHQRAVEIFKKIKPDFREFAIRVLRDPYDEYLDDKLEDRLSLKGGDTVVTDSMKVADRTNNRQTTFARTYTVPIKSESNGSTNSVNNLKQFLMKDQEQKTKSTSSTLPPGMSLTDGSISRNNIIYTTLVKDYKNDLGLVLENKNYDSEAKSGWSNIVIAEIKANSIASRDGKLQVDDRLLSVNGTDVTGVDLDRIMLMLDGTERFIRIVVSRGDSDDPLGTALRNMPTRPSLGSWFSSTTNMSHRPSLIESYQRPTFGSVSSLQKQPPGQLIGTKPEKPPKPSHLIAKDSDDTERFELLDDNPIAKPRNRVSSSQQQSSQISDAERRAAWRRERLKSIEDDVEMAKLIAEAQRRRREDK